MGALKPPHRRGDYDARAKRVVDSAKRRPGTRCWRCGRTLDQHRPHHDGSPAFWTAGHVLDGDPTSTLLPEASTCNFAAGGRLGNQRRHQRNGNPTSRPPLQPIPPRRP